MSIFEILPYDSHMHNTPLCQKSDTLSSLVFELVDQMCLKNWVNVAESG